MEKLFDTPYRLTYILEGFDVNLYEVGCKDRLTVELDGKSKYESFRKLEKGGKLKQYNCQKVQVPREFAKKLIDDVYAVIKNATSEQMIIDDYSGTVKLKFIGGEIIASRALCDDNGIDVDMVVDNFICEYFDKN